MKSLYLIRHAKSDWNAPSGSDHDRPLNPRGRRSAQLVGRFLKAVDQAPDAVLTSSAVRARTTVDLIVEAGGFNCPVLETRALYECHAMDVVEEIRQSKGAVDRLLVAGHEPTWSSLAALFCGGRARMVTAALVRIDFEVATWGEVGPELGTLVFMLPPRLLAAAAKRSAEWTNA